MRSPRPARPRPALAGKSPRSPPPSSRPGLKPRTCQRQGLSSGFGLQAPDFGLRAPGRLVGPQVFAGPEVQGLEPEAQRHIRCDNNPSRSFGSNQVDLGGMIPPASEIVIRSSTLTGYIEKATAYLADVTN